MENAGKVKALIDGQMTDGLDAEPSDLATVDGGDLEETDPEGDASEEAQTARKLTPEVGYMELGEPAGAFSCGNCQFAQPGEDEDTGTCIHESVRAQISLTNGCCNLIALVSDVEVVFPPTSADAAEVDDEDGDLADLDGEPVDGEDDAIDDE